MKPRSRTPQSTQTRPPSCADSNWVLWHAWHFCEPSETRPRAFSGERSAWSCVPPMGRKGRAGGSGATHDTYIVRTRLRGVCSLRSSPMWTLCWKEAGIVPAGQLNPSLPYTAEFNLPILSATESPDITPILDPIHGPTKMV
eukprot:scaffold256_cov121-Isochrysis_galbana.AAC.7